MSFQDEYPLEKVDHEVIHSYLDLMAGTESPPIFHTWSLISAASAALGRRCWFDLGPIRIMPNQYIMLVGAPGVRKSSCISLAKQTVEKLPQIKFAPNNTAGRLQGLLARMIGNAPKEDENIDEGLENLWAQVDNMFGDDSLDQEEVVGNKLDRHALYVMEGELAGFLGVKSSEFITFLTDMWDKSGELEYSYQLKSQEMRVPFPCLNLLGAITQQHVTTHLPPEAIGQGFMSRVVMVYAENGKKVAWPEPLDETKLNGFRKIFQTISDTFDGAFKYTDETKKAVIRLHERGYGSIEDARFIHYLQRRQSHMIKVAMAMAALRLSGTVEASDIYAADELLKMTEDRMSDSLGEYGMSAIALARARIVEILKNANEPLTAPRLAMACGGDVRQTDLQRAIYELNEQDVIKEIVIEETNGTKRTAYTTPRQLIKKPIDQSQPKPPRIQTAMDAKIKEMGEGYIEPVTHSDIDDAKPIDIMGMISKHSRKDN